MFLDIVKPMALNGRKGLKFERSQVSPYRSYIMPKKKPRKVLVVEGELENLLHGQKHSAIIQIVCKDQTDAEQVLFDRIGIYKKLVIKEILI